MKTQRRLRPLVVATGLLVACVGQAQVSVPTNNSNAGDYVGCDATSPFSLRIMQNDNWPIDWYTNAIQRLRLNHTTNYTIGSFTAQNADGYLGLSPDVSLWSGGTGPFSRLHLHDGSTPQTQSFRPWMRNGINFTGNQDQGYLGQKAGEIDFTDMVLHWSDNPGEELKDRLRFIFTSGFDAGAVSGAQSVEGLEALRVFPARFDEAYVGVGDFYAANLVDPLVVEPTERLDVLNGRVRIRQLPDDPECTNHYKVMVVDDSPMGDPERGVVKWITPTAGGIDCDWEEVNGDVFTAYLPDGTNPDCPEEDNTVGIGTSAADSKLHVTTNDFAQALHVQSTMATANNIGTLVEASGGTTQTTALSAAVTGGSPTNIGATISATGATGANIGNTIVAGGSAGDNAGVFMLVNGATNANAGITANISGAAAENIGMDFSVSGAVQSNTGGGYDVSGAATSNTGVDAMVNGATDTNTGYQATVSGEATTHHGVLVDVSGAEELNNGAHITVSGPTTYNFGADIHTSDGTGENTGIRATATTAGGSWNTGVQTITQGSTVRARGYWGTTSGATFTGYAVLGEELSTGATYSKGVTGTSAGAVSQSYGVFGAADGNANVNCGLYGRGGATPMTPGNGRYGLWAGTTGVGATDWGGWIQGRLNVQGSIWVNGLFFTSDEEVKENIAVLPASDATAVLESVDAVTYNYTEDAVEEMDLPAGEQVGLSAQQVQAVAPHLVQEKVQPAVLDSLGNIVQPERTILTVNYVGLVPYLLAGFQQLKAENAAMRQDIDACCALNDSGLDLPGQVGRVAITEVADLEDERLAISPNPFIGSTTVSYYLPTTGRVRLEVSDGDGRAVKTLRDEEAMEGTHQYLWNTESLAPGSYYVALVVDGNTIVKKAVKVSER